MVFDIPITIQKVDEATEQWNDVFNVHAKINKSKGNNEYLSGGSIRAKETLVFEIRYFNALNEIRKNTQLFRITYDDIPYNIEDYDDFMMNHKTVKLLGTSY